MDLRVTLEDFCILKEISRGGFGNIVMARRKDDRDGDNIFAIKQVSRVQMVKHNLLQQIQAERNAQAISNNPFVVRIFYSFMSGGGESVSCDTVNLVMEYMPGGDLKSLLAQQGAFLPGQALLYVGEMAQALHYLHQHHIIHRDVKPDNILIGRSGHIKLTDFGLCHVAHQGRLQVSELLASPLTHSTYHRTPGQVLSLTSQLTVEDSPYSELLEAQSEVVRRVARSHYDPFAMSGAYMSRVLLASGEATHARRSVPSLASEQDDTSVVQQRRSTDDETPVQIPRVKSRTLSRLYLEDGEQRRMSSESINLNSVFDSDDDDGRMDVEEQEQQEKETKVVFRLEEKEGGEDKEECVKQSLDRNVFDSANQVRLGLRRKRSMVALSEHTGLSKTLSSLELIPASSHCSPRHKRVSRADSVHFSTPKKDVSVCPVVQVVGVSPPAISTPHTRLQTPYRLPMTSAKGRASVRCGRHAAVMEDNREKVLGTPHYMAPESFVLGEGGESPINVTAAVDWWALGVCLFEFLTGYLPFTGESVCEIFSNIKLARIDWPEDEGEEEGLSPEQVTAIQALLHVSPGCRPGLAGLRELEVFQGLDLDNLLAVRPHFIPVLDDDTDTFYFKYRNTNILPNRQMGNSTDSFKENR